MAKEISCWDNIELSIMSESCNRNYKKIHSKELTNNYWSSS